MRPDHRAHLIAGFAIGFSVSVTFKRDKQSFGWGASAGTLAGLGKEFNDGRLNMKALSKGQPQPHTVEMADAGFTIAGALIGAYIGHLLFR